MKTIDPRDIGMAGLTIIALFASFMLCFPREQRHSIDASIIAIDPCVEITSRYDNYFGEELQSTTYGGEPRPTGIIPAEYPRNNGTWTETGDEDKSKDWSIVNASIVGDIGVCIAFNFDFNDDKMTSTSDVAKLFFRFDNPAVGKLLDEEKVKITITY